MAEIEFSPEQKKVIETRDSNLLVSAAAGSGKTAVLVRRIIEKVINDHVDIDRILVLTFTEAAAGEMRERIEKAITQEARNNPEDKNIARQAVLIHNAQISTIHGFCLSLLRNNFTEIDLDPSFRVAEPGEIKLVEGNIADELLEELFESDEVENFELLADRFVKDNKLDNLKETILKAYSVCRNNPFVEEYIMERKGDYEYDPDKGIFNTAWGEKLKEYTDRLIEEAIKLTKYNISLAEGPDGAYQYLDNLKSDLSRLEALPKTGDYSSYYNAFNGFAFDRLSTKKAEVSEESKNQAKAIREDVKDIVVGLAKDLYFVSEDKLMEGMKANSEVISALADVLLMYHRRIEEEKRSRKIIDFSDMEHYALRILLKKENGEYVPSQIARDYRDSFNEIMVDEYQDSNHVQEQILCAISGEEDNKFNRFMVGDVKQSIYSFRNACPEIFMQKFYDYGSNKDNEHVRIDLSANYRSRKEVLESVNYIFDRIMNADLGGITYSPEVRLNAEAKYTENCDMGGTELLILDYDGENDEKKQQQEARMVALRIEALMKGGYLVKDKEELRKLRYNDIVILLRSNKGWDEIFKKELERKGIPAFISSKTGYFSAKEIKMILNLLQVLDNPRNEIELYGALTGYFGGFDVEEVALIRAYSKKELYDSIVGIANDDFEEIDKITDDIKKKCTDFCAFFNKYREKIVYTPINELLEEIITQTGYMYYVGSLPFGEQRRANVYMLIEKAKQYESGSFKGLYHFVRYIDEIQSYEVDYGEASILDEQSDVVRIMSIHKSKGLEFPVCFVSGMGKNFNFMDTNNAVLYDRNYGIGLDYIDTQRNVRFRDVRKNFLRKLMHESIVAEEMRILYVALTRAKEKLIMTACVKDAESTCEATGRYNGITAESGKFIPYYVRSKCSSYMDFIMNSMDSDNKYIQTEVKTLDTMDREDVEYGVERAERKEALKSEVRVLNETASDDLETLKNKIMFKYSHDVIADLYTKTSVSELKIAAIEKAFLNNELEDTSAEFFTEHESQAYVPRFAGAEEKVRGTTRGTAYHRVMELYDFENTDNFRALDYNSQHKNVTSVINSMVENGKIDADMAELVDSKKVIEFLKSDLGERMCRAARRGELFLEEPFVLGINADRLKESFPKEETVLIQGIIDAFFIENGKIVLMDYKTDNVSSEEELVKKYKLQLEYYAEALSRHFEMEVSEQLIYSFAFGKTISI